MKALRVALIVVVSLVGLLVLLFLLLFLVPAVPTWIAVKAMSGQPDSQVRIEKIDLDWNGLMAKEVHMLMDKGPSISLQEAKVRIKFLPLLKKQVRVEQLVASGLVIDLTEMEPKEEAEDEESEPFRGVLSPIRESGILLFVDGVDVSGKIFLPENRSGNFTVSGGDIAPGATGILTSKATIQMPPDANGGIAQVVSSQRVSITQDEEGIAQAAIESQTIATGPAISGEARLFTTLQARVSAEGELYQLALRSTEGEPIAEVEAAYEPESDALTFAYSTNVDEASVAALGFEGVVPPFSLQGAGQGAFVLEELSGFAAGELSGKVSPQNLETGGQLPEVDFALRYDVQGDQKAVSLRQIKAEGSVGGEQALRLVLAPNLVIDLQDPVGSLPDAPLAELFLDVPLQVLLSEQVREGRLRGQFDIAKLQQAISVQSTQPLQLSNLLVIGEAMPREPISVQLAPSLTLNGKQLDFAVGSIAGSLGKQSFIDGSVRGRLVLADEGQPQPAEASLNGNLRIDLDTLYPLLSPEVAEAAQQGRITLRFSASKLADSQVLSGQFNSMLNDVKPPDATDSLSLRASGSFEADLQKQSFYLNAPINFTGAAGRTDLTAELQVNAAEQPIRIGAALSGPAVYADDFIALSTAYSAPATEDSEPAEPEPPAPTPPEGPDSEPLWAGLAGEASTSIGKIVIGANEITNFNSRISITSDKIELSEFNAALAGEPITAAFSLAFSGPPTDPYVLQAEFNLTEFDLGAVDQELREDQPPLMEGQFNAKGHFQGSGPNLPTVAEWVEGSVLIEAKQATYYPLGNFKAPAVSGIVSAASQILPGLLKDKGQQSFAIASQQIFSLLQGVETEHLVVDLDVNKGLQININQFELLSSQLSFTGSGALDMEMGESPMRWPFNLKLKMGAKGNAAHLFNDIGALNAQENEYGYYTTKIDFPMGGRIGMPTSGLGQSLLGMAQSFMNPQRVELPEPDIKEPPPQEVPPAQEEGEGKTEQPAEPDPLNMLFDLLNQQQKKKASPPQQGNTPQQ